MISRRHIRIKVMQSLYSYFTLRECDRIEIQKNMIQSIESVKDLHKLILSILMLLRNYAKDQIETNKLKHLPTIDDLDPNMKFINNRVIELLMSDDDFRQKNNSSIRMLVNNDLDLIRRMYVKIIKSPEYSDYLLDEEDTLELDKSFIKLILNNFIFDNEFLHQIIKEHNIYWMDDLPFVSIFLNNQISFLKNKSSFRILKSSFKNIEDKNFAISLFQSTIENYDEFNNLVKDYSKNWDLDRIANMDILLINMALSEIISFNEMPVNVSFNEYIEISKYYSTENSKVFINGMLDKIVNDFKRKNRIHKQGRGLL